MPRSRSTVLWFDHDPSDGEHVRPAGVGSFGAWFQAWARLGFGSFGDENERVIAFLRGGKLAPLANDDTPSPSPQKSAAKKQSYIEAPVHKEQVWAVAVLADGARGASASNDGVIHVFDLATGARTAKLAAISRVYALIAHPFEAWDVESGERTKTLTLDGRVGVAAIAVTPDGRRAIVGSVYGWVLVCDLAAMT